MTPIEHHRYKSCPRFAAYFYDSYIPIDISSMPAANSYSHFSLRQPLCFALSASQCPRYPRSRTVVCTVNMPPPAPVLPLHEDTGRLMAPNCLLTSRTVIEHPPQAQTSVLFWERGGCTELRGRNIPEWRQKCSVGIKHRG